MDEIIHDLLNKSYNRRRVRRLSHKFDACQTCRHVRLHTRLSSLVVEHLSCKQKVVGSNPIWACEFFVFFYTFITQ